MWTFTKDGFFSAVEDIKDHSRVVVRAREKADIVRLAKKIGVKPYKSGAYADYEYRLWAKKIDWAEYLAMSVTELDYPNFKDAMAKRFGAKRMDQLHTVWAVMAGYFGVEKEDYYGEDEEEAALRSMRLGDTEKSEREGLVPPNRRGTSVRRVQKEEADRRDVEDFR